MNKTLSLLYCLVLLTNVTFAQTVNPAPYCPYTFSSSSTTIVSGGIINVSLGSLNNTTSAGTSTSLYTYYNNLTAPSVTQGVLQNLNLTVNNCVNGEPMYGAVYIDYNQNMIFSPSELVWSQGPIPLPTGNSGGPNVTIPINFTVPFTSTVGMTRMRVIRFQDSLGHSGASNFVSNYIAAPCNSGWTGTYNFYGEVEDYNLNIVAGALQPTIITTAASAVTTNTATLNGNANMNGIGTGTLEFDYGTGPSYGSTVAATPTTASGTTTINASANLSSLLPGTLYHYRLKATDGTGTVYLGNDLTFVTTALPTPILYVTGATAVLQTTATLNGTGNLNGVTGPGTVTFEYGTTTAYGTSIPSVPSTITGSASNNLTGNVIGLLPNTLYHYRITVNANGNIFHSNDTTFITSAVPQPIIATLPATNVTDKTATLNGIVNMNNSGTGTLSFEFGTTTSYGSVLVASPSMAGGNNNLNFNHNLTGLTPNTVYHYRAVVTEQGVKHYGSDNTFTTSAVPLPLISTTSATSISSGSAVLHGFVNANNYGACNVSFEWGSSINLGNVVAAFPALVNGNQLIGVSTNLNTTFVPNSTYYYRLVANVNGQSFFGNILSFTIPAPLGIVQDLDTKGANIFPSPFIDHFDIECKEGIHQVNLLDITGRTVWSEKFNGESKVQIHPINIATGMYIAEIIGDENQWLEKVFKK